MTVSGWIVMGISIGSVLTLLTYCLYKTFTLPPPGDE